MGDLRPASGQMLPSELAIPSPPVSPAVMSPQTEDMLRRSVQSDDGSIGLIPYLPQSTYLYDLRHNVGVEAFPTSMQGDVGVVSKWRMKDRVSSKRWSVLLKVVFILPSAGFRRSFLSCLGISTACIGGCRFALASKSSIGFYQERGKNQF
jgi:hypothetical protein